MKALSVLLGILPFAKGQSNDASVVSPVGRSLPVTPDSINIINLFMDEFLEAREVSKRGRLLKNKSNKKKTAILSGSPTAIKKPKTAKTNKSKKFKKSSGGEEEIVTEEEKLLKSELAECSTKIEAMSQDTIEITIDMANYLNKCTHLAERLCSLQDDLYFQYLLNHTIGECYAEESYQVKTFHENELMPYDNVITKEELENKHLNKDDFPCVEGDWYSKTTDGMLVKNNGCVNEPGETDPKLQWCSTKTKKSTDENGNVIDLHVRYNYSYCHEKGFRRQFKKFLRLYDTNNNGVFELEEVVPNLSESRRGRSGVPAVECSQTPDEECSGYFTYLNPNCYQWNRSLPSNDDVLVRILGAVAADSYAEGMPGNDAYAMRSTFVEGRDNFSGGGTWAERVHSSDICRPSVATGTLGLIQYLVSHILSIAVQIALQVPLPVILMQNDAARTAYILALGLDCPDDKTLHGFSVYKILKGEHTDKYILALMGTNDSILRSAAGIQFPADLNTSRGGPIIRRVGAGAVAAYNYVVNDLNYDIEYVTGHSLGGLSAEMLTDAVGVKGASFAALGGYTANPFTNLMRIGNFDEVEFDVVLHESDTTSQLIFENLFDTLRLTRRTSHIALSCNVRTLDFICSGLSCHSSKDHARFCSSEYNTELDGTFSKNQDFIDNFDSVAA
eukprot:CAMPEP_0194271352 /NCGR_PEP_ID=MMETSP0169-20130528/5154_1 /TAXON_ID=218684 /ORGANISM="Corethron pennatum, Strain L29A3" /LENGTH=673 /DNA_ID=CAMNT_0039013679 /DNA_START=286 /DNA_END=2307 /DNA_ORIENTATION=+